MKTHSVNNYFGFDFIHTYFYVKLVLYEIQKYFSENQSGGYDIYASLPRSLKKEVLVRSKVEEDPDVLQARQAIVSSKSPAELRSSSSHVFTIPESRGRCPKFAPGLNIKIGIVQKVYG